MFNVLIRLVFLLQYSNRGCGNHGFYSDMNIVQAIYRLQRTMTMVPAALNQSQVRRTGAAPAVAV